MVSRKRFYLMFICLLVASVSLLIEVFVAYSWKDLAQRSIAINKSQEVIIQKEFNFLKVQAISLDQCEASKSANLKSNLNENSAGQSGTLNLKYTPIRI